MSNAGEGFTAQRPQPYYQPVQQVGGQQNVGAIAMAGGLLDAYKTVDGLINGTPQDNYYKALETSQKDTQLAGAYDLITATDDPEARSNIRAGILKIHPEWADVIPEDVTNLKKGDFESQQRLKASKRMAGAGDRVWEENYGDKQTGSTQTQEPLSPGTTTQQGPENLHAGEPKAVIQPDGNIGPSHEGMPEAVIQPDGNIGPSHEGQPEATILPDDTIGTTQEDPNVTKIRAASQMTGRPEDEFWVSNNTGEVNLRPELIGKYPHLPPAAFQDVLAQGPEDVPIAEVTAAHIPSIKQAQNELLQAGAAFRVWRSVELGIEAKPEDMMAMSLTNAQMDIYKAEAAAKLGIVDPEEIDLFAMQCYANVMNPLTPPDVRYDPRSMEGAKKVMAMSPTLQKLHVSGAESMVDADIDHAKWQAQVSQFDQQQALRQAEHNEEVRKNKWEQTVREREVSAKEVEAGAASTRASADLIKAGGWKTEKQLQDEYNREQAKVMAEIKNLNARTASSGAELKNKSTANPKLYELAAQMYGKDAARTQGLMDSYGKLVGSTQSAISSTNQQIGALSAKLPSTIDTIIQRGQILERGSLTGAELAAFDEATKDTANKATISQINELITRRGNLTTQLDTHVGNLTTVSNKALTEFQKQPADRQDDFLRQMMQINPAGATNLMEADIISGLPPGADKVFRTLSVGHPDLSKAKNVGETIAILKGPPYNFSSDEATLKQIISARNAWIKQKKRLKEPTK